MRDGRVGAHTSIRFEPVTGDQFVPAGSLDLVRFLVDHPGAGFGRRFTFERAPWVTLSTAVLLAVAFGWQLRDAPLTGAVLLDQGAKSLAHQIELGQWWRLLTAPLLHAGWAHLVPNLMYVLYVGWNVESLLGRSGTLLVVVGSAVVSMVVSSIATPLPTVGASGITFGLFGASLALGWRYGTYLPPRAARRFGWSVLPFIIYFLAFGALWSDWVDNFCHLGGLAMGALLGLILRSVHEDDAGRSRATAIELGVSLGLCLLVGVGVPAAWRLELLPGVGPGVVVQEFRQGGYSLRPPIAWLHERADDTPSWRSTTGATRLTTTAWVEEHAPPTRDEVRAVWVADLQRSGAVVATRPEAILPKLPPDLLGCFSLEMDLVADGALLRALNVGCIRGTHVTTVQFVHPLEHWRGQRRLREALLATVRLTEPETLRLARSGAVEPQDQAAQLVLAATLARLGRREEAEVILAELEIAVPDAPELLYWRLWVELHLGDGRAWAADREEMAERMLLLEPESLSFVALAFDVFLDRGHLNRAREVLQHLRSRWPERSLTKDRIARLAAAGG